MAQPQKKSYSERRDENQKNLQAMLERALGSDAITSSETDDNSSSSSSSSNAKEVVIRVANRKMMFKTTNAPAKKLNKTLVRRPAPIPTRVIPTRSSLRNKTISIADLLTPAATSPVRSLSAKTPRRPYPTTGVVTAAILNVLGDENRDSVMKVANLYPLWDKEKRHGAIPGIPVGALFLSRRHLSVVGLHRPLVAGIWGNPENGCYSIVLSGGYEEDEDHGDVIKFTGSGGRDLKGTATNPKNLRCAEQTFDQPLNASNGSLVESIISQVPIRVSRGYKSPYINAPSPTLYRYDGLYVCTRYWNETGKTNFKVFRFELKRLPGQPALDTLPTALDDSRFAKIIATITKTH